MDLILDVNIQIYPVDLGKINDDKQNIAVIHVSFSLLIKAFLLPSDSNF